MQPTKKKKKACYKYHLITNMKMGKKNLFENKNGRDYLILDSGSPA